MKKKREKEKCWFKIKHEIELYNEKLLQVFFHFHLSYDGILYHFILLMGYQLWPEHRHRITFLLIGYCFQKQYVID